MTEIESNTQKLLEFISKNFESNKLNNESLVQLIELCGTYLNIATIPDYCNREKISYNGAKHFRNVVTIFNVKFIIDNN